MSGDSQSYKKNLLERYYLEQLNQIVDTAIALKDDGHMSDQDLKHLWIVLQLEFKKPMVQWKTDPVNLFKKFKHYRQIEV